VQQQGSVLFFPVKRVFDSLSSVAAKKVFNLSTFRSWSNRICWFEDAIHLGMPFKGRMGESSRENLNFFGFPAHAKK
jgi:hypothetical protein